MDDVQNSSDIDFQPAIPKTSGRHVGQASIASVIEHAAEDRTTSKKTVKQLEFGHGAPGTRLIQELWVTRFNKFRQCTLN